MTAFGVASLVERRQNLLTELRGLLDDGTEDIGCGVAKPLECRHLPDVEQVKKFEILPRDLSQESGELTPTLKVKRAVVVDKYEPQIEALYSD